MYAAIYVQIIPSKTFKLVLIEETETYLQDSDIV
jgi:hypothetical protein